jgi:hypothetical protein
MLSRMTVCGGLRVLLIALAIGALVVPIGAVAQEPAEEVGAARPQAGESASASSSAGCVAGGVYDPACDVNHDGIISVEDIELTASRWGTSGTWTSGSWDLTGNSGTTAGTDFLGTTDNEPLELRVDGARALRLEPNSISANLIGGHSNNSVADGVVGATIGGGGSPFYWNTAGGHYNTVGGGLENTTSNWYATLSGGRANTASGFAATVGGGRSNVVSADYGTIAGGGPWDPDVGPTTTGNRVTDVYGTIGGGGGNQAGDAAGTTTDAWHATVGGGWRNTASGRESTVGGGSNNAASGRYSTVAGGETNTANGRNATVAGDANGHYSAVGGGWSNTASGNYSAVCGGYDHTASGVGSLVCGGASSTASGEGAAVLGGHANTAGGDYSLALGYEAHAKHSGAFVWSDASGAGADKPLSSTAENQFVARASGGVQLYANAEATTGVLLPPGSGAWSVHSDRDAKTDFAAVDAASILEALSKLPVETWRYKAQAGVRHIGPTAQDFHAAFGLGASDTQTSHISTVDTDGVALAAIQALYAKVEALEAENAELQQRLAALEASTDNPSSAGYSGGQRDQ